VKRILLFLGICSLLVFSVPAEETMYSNRRGVRVRKEPHTTATVVTTLRSGAAVTVIDSVDGDKVSGSTLWYHVNTGMYTGYVHSSLLTSTVPGSAAPPATSGSSGSTSPQTQSTPAPLVEQPVPPPSSGASCNGATKCTQMTSCDQAYACLAAGNGRLDGDSDGVPCESICG
jgi:hypothetical protein